MPLSLSKVFDYPTECILRQTAFIENPIKARYCPFQYDHGYCMRNLLFGEICLITEFLFGISTDFCKGWDTPSLCEV